MCMWHVAWVNSPSKVNTLQLQSQLQSNDTLIIFCTSQSIMLQQIQLISHFPNTFSYNKQSQKMVPEFLSPTQSGSLSTTEPYRWLKIQHICTEHQCTFSSTLTPTTTNATPTHKVPSSFVLGLTQPELGADCPSSPQACITAYQTLHAWATT